MEEFTMQGTFTLPSQGKFYGDGTVSDVTIRSMTTNEEMKRLNHSDKGYKVMADVIDACIVSEFPVSSYDLCLADYQFLLHKLRVVTYGTDYKMSILCPHCGTQSVVTINLDDLEVSQFSDDEYKKYSEFDLPQSKKHIRLSIQTPRIIDSIQSRVKDQKRRTPEMEGDPTLLFTLESLIAEVDGEIIDPIDRQRLVRGMGMMDANYILKHAQKLAESFGISNIVEVECPTCGLTHDANFRVTSEFYGPSIDF